MPNAEVVQPLLTISEAAAYLKLSESAVYALCKSRKLAHYRLPVRGRGKIVTTPADCEAFLLTCRVPAGANGKPVRPDRGGPAIELPSGVPPFRPRA